MSEIKVEISELKKEDEDLVNDLVSFLKEKAKTDVEKATNDIILKNSDKNVSRTHLRLLLRKFLHKEELKELFRVIGGKENTLIIKEIKVKEEEE